MMMNCDRFFIAELQEAGYDLDYKTVRDIYKRSRVKHNEEIMRGKTKYRKAEVAAMEIAAELDKHLED